MPSNDYQKMISKHKARANAFVLFSFLCFASNDCIRATCFSFSLLHIFIYLLILLLTRQFEKQYLDYTETFYVFKYYKMKRKEKLRDFPSIGRNFSRYAERKSTGTYCASL